MAVVRTIITGSGATVNFHDEGYKSATEQELSVRRENMLTTAGQTAQENELCRLRQSSEKDTSGGER